jgi:uncharacterized LabA/DUF88 family protein
MNRVVADVDGFNLYFGLKEAHGRRYHWLDLQRLVADLLQPDQQLRAVQYFTARIRDDPEGGSRQSTYLDALANHSPLVHITEGRFKERPRGCRSCGARWVVYEEKETDVNIAIAMIKDAAQDIYDTAILVSGDTDLRPVVATVKQLRPDKRIVVAFPPRRHSKALMRAADAFITIGHGRIHNAQLPPEIITKGGVALTRPAHWS